MNRLRAFIQTSIIGGIVVILPVALLALFFKWIFKLTTDIIQPLTNLVMAASQFHRLIADALALGLILAVCFLIGVIVKTKIGKYIQENLEKNVLSFAPGYSTIKETVMQFLGKSKRPFSSAALIQAYENDTLMTGFVTDEHPDGSYTVFVPTAPNPTTGFVFHLKRQYVHPVPVSVEEALRSVISCGAGSTKLLKAYGQKI
ncbi:DUF502 domain-containing protein [Thermodesulfobacteriota bacterium]